MSLCAHRLRVNRVHRLHLTTPRYSGSRRRQRCYTCSKASDTFSVSSPPFTTLYQHPVYRRSSALPTWPREPRPPEDSLVASPSILDGPSIAVSALSVEVKLHTDDHGYSRDVAPRYCVASELLVAAHTADSTLARARAIRRQRHNLLRTRHRTCICFCGCYGLADKVAHTNARHIRQALNGYFRVVWGK